MQSVFDFLVSQNQKERREKLKQSNNKSHTKNAELMTVHFGNFYFPRRECWVPRGSCCCCVCCDKMVASVISASLLPQYPIATTPGRKVFFWYTMSYSIKAGKAWGSHSALDGERMAWQRLFTSPRPACRAWLETSCDNRPPVPAPRDFCNTGPTS